MSRLTTSSLMELRAICSSSFFLSRRFLAAPQLPRSGFPRPPVMLSGAGDSNQALFTFSNEGTRTLEITGIVHS